MSLHTHILKAWFPLDNFCYGNMQIRFISYKYFVEKRKWFLFSVKLNMFNARHAFVSDIKKVFKTTLKCPKKIVMCKKRKMFPFNKSGHQPFYNFNWLCDDVVLVDKVSANLLELSCKRCDVPTVDSVTIFGGNHATKHTLNMKSWYGWNQIYQLYLQTIW